jgi:sec-independent protein translocase protein TatC
LYFLVGFGGQFTPLVTINEYWDLATRILVAVGIVFELPVVILLLSLLGIVTPKFLLRNFRYGVLLTAVIALAIVPSNDMASIFVVWIPLVGLYVLSIGLSWLVYFRKSRKSKNAEA